MLKQAYIAGWNAAFAKLALAAPTASATPDTSAKLPSLKLPSSGFTAEFPQATPGGSGKGFTAAQSSSISPGVANAGMSGLEQNFGQS
jgi:hypothetical protein